MVDTSIAGIPCTVELEYHKAFYGEKEDGLPLEPDEPAHSDIVNIFKRGGEGKHLQWLEDKMTDEERERIERGQS